MTRILHLDASARPGLAGIDAHGSHSRALTARFVERWSRARPETAIVRRDLGRAPPAHVDHAWIRAAFAPAGQARDRDHARLAESDRLIDELIAADLLVIGAPLYNFGMPSTLKAWIDNIVRIGRTVTFDPTRPDDPYAPLLADRPRTAVVLTSRGGHDMGPGAPLAHMNHLEPHLRTALGFIGIHELHAVAVEHQESGGEVLAQSARDAAREVDALVDRLLARVGTPPATAAA